MAIGGRLALVAVDAANGVEAVAAGAAGAGRGGAVVGTAGGRLAVTEGEGRPAAGLGRVAVLGAAGAG
ncbi:MAG: hypothetical protein EOL89_00035 [Actinobacteria bacterium]|nr:hypothetical protein [Actinomycetota bacterium]